MSDELPAEDVNAPGSGAVSPEDVNASAGEARLSGDVDAKTSAIPPPEFDGATEPAFQKHPTGGAWLALILAAIAMTALLVGIVFGERLGLDGGGDTATSSASPTMPANALSEQSLPPPDTAGLSTGIVVPGRASLGELAPDFELETPDGGTVKLSDFKGQPVILNFWATWCRPCQVEMPYLQSAFTEHADKGLVVLAVNVAEQTALVKPFLEERNLSFPVGLDLNSRVAELYRIFSYPTTYLIDRDGRVINVRRGIFANQFDLDQNVALILPEAKEQ